MMERQSNHDRVKFNVGGRIFETTSTTLANAGRNSYFGAMFDDNWNFIPKLNSITNNNNQQSIYSSEHFIDRNPDCFAVLLDLLRTGTLHIPQNLPENLLYNEATFYGLTNHLRTAKWSSPIDGNRLTLSHSVTGHAPGDGTAIRASPDGGCAVAHGCMVHIYDWTLIEHPSLHLDYQIINDMLYINNNPENIIISACEKSGRGDSGMGLFSASDGKLRHKYEIYHDNQIKSYTAGALSYDLKEGYIYASCKGRSNEYGIGMWDEVTGKQVDFFYEPVGWSLGEADRLQWLDERNCLLVATLFPRKDNCYISLVDFRVKRKMVWSWSDAGGVDEKRVRDAVAMEDSICVVNEFEDLGFMDVRSGGVNGGGSVRWSSRSKLAMNRRKMVMDFEPCYPKLGFHQGQLFSSMNDCVSVFSGPDWVLTSRLRRSNGGSICDFSIGGDRLFALHSEENVFDVWETPPSI